jgi:uncharacterized protein YjbI with pentapeptide repeats
MSKDSNVEKNQQLLLRKALEALLNNMDTVLNVLEVSHRPNQDLNNTLEKLAPAIKLFAADPKGIFAFVSLSGLLANNGFYATPDQIVEALHLGEKDSLWDKHRDAFKKLLEFHCHNDAARKPLTELIAGAAIGNILSYVPGMTPMVGEAVSQALATGSVAELRKRAQKVSFEPNQSDNLLFRDIEFLRTKVAEAADKALKDFKLPETLGDTLPELALPKAAMGANAFRQRLSNIIRDKGPTIVMGVLQDVAAQTAKANLSEANYARAEEAGRIAKNLMGQAASWGGWVAEKAGLGGAVDTSKNMIADQAVALAEWGVGFNLDQLDLNDHEVTGTNISLYHVLNFMQSCTPAILSETEMGRYMMAEGTALLDLVEKGQLLNAVTQANKMVRDMEGTWFTPSNVIDLAKRDFLSRVISSNYSYITIHDASFAKQDLSGANFAGSTMIRPDFNGAILHRVSFGAYNMPSLYTQFTEDVNFTGAHIDPITMLTLAPAIRRTNARRIEQGVEPIDLDGAILEGDFREMDLSGLSMRGVDATKAKTKGANIDGSNITNIKFAKDENATLCHGSALAIVENPTVEWQRHLAKKEEKVIAGLVVDITDNAAKEVSEDYLRAFLNNDKALGGSERRERHQFLVENSGGLSKGFANTANDYSGIIQGEMDFYHEQLDSTVSDCMRQAAWQRVTDACAAQLHDTTQGLALADKATGEAKKMMHAARSCAPPMSQDSIMQLWREPTHCAQGIVTAMGPALTTQRSNLQFGHAFDEALFAKNSPQIKAALQLHFGNYEIPGLNAQERQSVALVHQQVMTELFGKASLIDSPDMSRQMYQHIAKSMANLKAEDPLFFASIAGHEKEIGGQLHGEDAALQDAKTGLVACYYPHTVSKLISYIPPRTTWSMPAANLTDNLRDDVIEQLRATVTESQTIHKQRNQMRIAAAKEKSLPSLDREQTRIVNRLGTVVLGKLQAQDTKENDAMMLLPNAQRDENIRQQLILQIRTQMRDDPTFAKPFFANASNAPDFCAEAIAPDFKRLYSGAQLSATDPASTMPSTLSYLTAPYVKAAPNLARQLSPMAANEPLVPSTEEKGKLGTKLEQIAATPAAATEAMADKTATTADKILQTITPDILAQQHGDEIRLVDRAKNFFSGVLSAFIAPFAVIFDGLSKLFSRSKNTDLTDKMSTTQSIEFDTDHVSSKTPPVSPASGGQKGSSRGPRSGAPAA